MNAEIQTGKKSKLRFLDSPITLLVSFAFTMLSFWLTIPNTIGRVLVWKGCNLDSYNILFLVALTLFIASTIIVSKKNFYSWLIYISHIFLFIVFAYYEVIMMMKSMRMTADCDNVEGYYIVFDEGIRIEYVDTILMVSPYMSTLLQLI